MTRFLSSIRRQPSVSKSMSADMEAKVVLANYYSALQQFESGRRAQHWPIERAVAEGYERVIWVFKSVNTIAGDHSRLPFRLKQDGQDVEDHPLCRVLNKQANPLETGPILRKRLSAQISLSKAGAFVEKTYSNANTIKRLDLLPPGRVEIMPPEDPFSDELIDHFRLTRRDGQYRRIDPKNVLWFRDPHPLDPYSGTTPLEAAGMSVELDYFARLYNISFLSNDGRPGGVLAVRNGDGTTTDMDIKQMDRTEAKFSKGPQSAGQLAVIAGDLSYVDLAAKPRDMQYGQVSRNSKNELLSSYGVSETVLGYAADRTYDNANAEVYIYWTITMAKHNDIIVSGFDEDSDDDLEGYLDTSSIEVLERGERAKREEARTEVAAGLRSIISYAKVAGIKDIESTPYTRALYVPSGKTPIPSLEEDAKALGLEQPTEKPAAAPEIPAAPPAAALPPGSEPGVADVAEPPQGSAVQAPEPGPSPAALPPGYAPAAAIGTGPALKALPAGARPVLRVKRAAPPITEELLTSELDERARDRLEDILTTALTVLSTRWIERTVGRLESTKSRKGTRHWIADPALPFDTRGGTKALDSAKAVDEDRWASEAEIGTEPIIAAAASLAAATLLADLDADEDETLAPSVIVAGIVGAVVRMISDSAGRQAMRLIKLINEADQAEQPLTDIVAMVREQSSKFASWASGIATAAATAAINGARDAAADEIRTTNSHADIRRTWLSRRDESVRPSHHDADGQEQPVGQPFLVGDALLRFPCDPLAPVHETAGCRCRLLHQSRRTGRFVRPPVSLATAS